MAEEKPENYIPPVGFHFLVEFTLDSLKKNRKDTYFQTVSGLSVDIETEEIAMGGENRYKQKLPVRTKFPNLVLKRGMLLDSELINWCRKAIEQFEFSTTDITVKLLNEEHKPLKVWNIVNAYPVKWNIDEFNAMESKLVLETIELSYDYFTLQQNQ